MVLLDAYGRDGLLVRTEEKDLLLAEIKEYSIANGDAHLAIPAVLMLLVHPENGIYVVRRAEKAENPHLWCKTVGGHIHHKETPAEALRRESQEEIRTDVLIAESTDEYEKLLMYTNLKEKAVVRKVDRQPWFRADRIDRETGRPWKRRFDAHIYIGKLHKDNLLFTPKSEKGDFEDGLGEAVDMRFYRRDDLRRIAVDEGDRSFTHDIGVLVRNYYGHLGI